MGETVLKAVDFIPVSAARCCVSSSPLPVFIDNKVIETEEEIPREELVRISNYLTESFCAIRCGRSASGCCGKWSREGAGGPCARPHHRAGA